MFASVCITQERMWTTLSKVLCSTHLYHNMIQYVQNALYVFLLACTINHLKNCPSNSLSLGQVPASKLQLPKVMPISPGKTATLSGHWNGHLNRHSLQEFSRVHTRHLTLKLHSWSSCDSKPVRLTAALESVRCLAVGWHRHWSHDLRPMLKWILKKRKALVWRVQKVQIRLGDYPVIPVGHQQFDFAKIKTRLQERAPEEDAEVKS